MITFLLRALLYVASAGVGLIVADLLLEGFRIQWARWWGFALCIVIFAVLQSILSPLITRVTDRYAPALIGGIGIISTLIALLIVVLLPLGGLRIVDATGWILGAVIVWVVTALGTVLLGRVFLRPRPSAERARRDR
ncbi:hypothetical protein [Microbacterium sp. 179-I 3D4 NHS]|uniref:hypothetical protein n=1 Tax=Microbacterium sp. 179-I 3D4 NHS TaxID=3142381 RepID=UPI00399F9674